MEQFYIVWNPKGNAPFKRHTFESEALKEAERLAKTQPNTEFFVALCTDRMFVPTAPVRTRLEAVIPF